MVGNPQPVQPMGFDLTFDVYNARTEIGGDHRDAKS
jgi:hypothetical protein